MHHHLNLYFIRLSAKCREKIARLRDHDICGATFSHNKIVCTILQQESRLICDVLLDQIILPGVGNIIKNEALFDSGINPNTKVCQKETCYLALVRHVQYIYSYFWHLWCMKCISQTGEIASLTKVTPGHNTWYYTHLHLLYVLWEQIKTVIAGWAIHCTWIFIFNMWQNILTQLA